MLLSMRHIELHMLETDSDLDLALQAGLLEPEQLVSTVCSDCDEYVAHVGDEFIPFAVVLDDKDRVWFVCEDCSAPVTDGAIEVTREVSLEGLIDEEFQSQSLFDDEEFEKF